jgi:hypothetical protein
VKAEDFSFSFRDVMRYVVPGALAIGLTLWFLKAFLDVNFSMWNPDLGDSIIFLLASYVVGHCLDLLGDRFLGGRLNSLQDKIQQQIHGGSYSGFTAEFRAKLNEMIQHKFGLPLSNEDINDICYNYLVQNKAAQATERYIAIQGLYRSLLVSIWIGLIFGASVLLKNAMLWLLTQSTVTIPVQGFFDFNLTDLATGFCLLAFFLLILRPLRTQLETFSEFAVADIYRSFYAYCARESLDMDA